MNDLPPKLSLEETEYEIIDAGTNRVMSVEERLATAESGEIIKSLLNVGNNAKPSGATRRRWLAAASKRYIELNAMKTTAAQPMISSPASPMMERSLQTNPDNRESFSS